MPKRKANSDPDAPVVGDLEDTDTPPSTTDSVTDLIPTPDFDLSDPQKKMIGLVHNGAIPDTAATVTGLDDGWRLDIPFSRHINQLHAFNIAQVEQAAFQAAALGKAVPAGIAFYLKCIAGWRDKFGDDGFAQHIEIQVEKVDGYAPMPTEEDPE